MGTLLWILLSTFLISTISLFGVVTLAFKEKLLNKLLMIFVALAAGALIGGAFLDLIPEALEQYNTPSIFIYSIIGFSAFFLIEKVFHWHHCHMGYCHTHTFAYMNLFGDAIHNFIDGVVMAASFLVSVPLGITTSLAIAMHEVPQGIGNYGVMLYAKIPKVKALMLNFGVSLTVIAGGIVSYLLAEFAGKSTMFLIPFAAGGFVYVAASDLIPEIKKEISLGKSLLNFAMFIAGILLIYFL